MTVRYAREGGRSIECIPLYSYTREDDAAAVLSASSGPKDYVRNLAAGMFQADPSADQIIVVRACSGRSVFFLVRRGDSWVDYNGWPVEGVVL